MSMLLMYALTGVAAACAAVVCYPLMSRATRETAKTVEQYQDVKAGKAVKALDEIFMEVKPKWLRLAYGVGPVVVGLVVFVVFRSAILAGVGAVVGIVLPDLCVRQVRALRRRRFGAQLVDALMILSSSLRAGLSMTQSFGQLATKITPPAL